MVAVPSPTSSQTVALAEFRHELRRSIPLYVAFVRNAFLNMLAYRLRYFTGIITYLLFVSVHYFIWQAVFSGHPEGFEINGFTLSEMISYVAIGWVSRSLYFSSIDNEIDELVRSGQISIYLLRPVHFHTMMLSQAAGESIFRLLFFTVPISLVIFALFPVSFPASLGSLAYFLLSTALSFLVLAEINFMTGLCAFWFKSIQGVMRAKYFLVQLLSGLLLPLSFFPATVQRIAECLPFKAIAYIPLQLYLGKLSGSDAWAALGEQVLWYVLLAMASYFLWRAAVRVLTLQGG